MRPLFVEAVEVDVEDPGLLVIEPHRRASVWACESCLVTSRVGPPHRFEEEPRAPLRLVDPDLEQARGREIAVLHA